MYLSIKYQNFYNFCANYIHAEFLTCPFYFLRDYYGDSKKRNAIESRKENYVVLL